MTETPTAAETIAVPRETLMEAAAQFYALGTIAMEFTGSDGGGKPESAVWGMYAELLEAVFGPGELPTGGHPAWEHNPAWEEARERGDVLAKEWREQLKTTVVRFPLITLIDQLWNKPAISFEQTARAEA